MFERYTEPGRRAIFFACYEASNYGSRHIESEHLLLGLLREDRGKWFPGPGKVEPEIRAEIEKRIRRHECIPTTVEVLNIESLSPAAKAALLARIAHTLTVCARDTYEVGTENALGVSHQGVV
jgi:hypothetical protein